MQKITPCLWFDYNAEEAVKFYTSIFKKSKIGKIVHSSESEAAVSGQPKGRVVTIVFQIEGQDFIALNGGPMFKFNEAISLSVDCKTQKDVDYYWKKLTADGGEESHCGWLKDKFGVSWQVVPSVLVKMFQDKDPKKVDRVMAAVLKMGKLNIKKLQNAYNK